MLMRAVEALLKADRTRNSEAYLEGCKTLAEVQKVEGEVRLIQSGPASATGTAWERTVACGPAGGVGVEKRRSELYLWDALETAARRL
jgi:hypothetical protein